MGNKKKRQKSKTKKVDQYAADNDEFDAQLLPIATRTRSRRQEEPRVVSGEDDVIGPHDSVSQVSRGSSSHGSYVSCLEIEAEALAERQELERAELEIRQRKEALELRIKRAKATASNGSRSGTSRASLKLLDSVVPPSRASSRLEGRAEPPGEQKRQTQWNPKAPEFRPGKLVDLEAEEDKPAVLKFLEEGQRQQRQLLDAVQLPKTEIIKFDGNPIRYWTFVNSFEANVENVTCDNAARLSRLLYYCEGKARNIIEPCAMMSPEEGYLKAKKLLRDRFGDPFIVTECWVEKVTKEGTVVQKDGLQDFADELRSCYECLKAAGCTAEIDSQRVLLKIAERLPTYLKARWIKEVHSIKSRESRVPSAGDLVTFVEMAAAEATDPVFGSLLGTNKHEKRKNNARSFSTVAKEKGYGNKRSHGIETTQREKPVTSSKGSTCQFCSDTHSPFQCPVFKGMRVSDRIKSVKDKNLCFNCLRYGHSSPNCKVERTCTVEDCGQKHTKFLHPIDGDRGRREDTGDNQETRVACNVTGAGIDIMLPIVPVRVRSGSVKDWIRTYALLDNGSSATFCNEKLKLALGLKGKNCSMKLTTVHGTQQQETMMVDLQISSPDGSVETELRNVHSVSNLPISSDHVATDKDIDEFAHLKTLKLPRSKPDEVGLLIGQDNCNIMMPLEVKCGEPGEPYATRTPLGWALNGPIRKEGRRNASANFVQCESLDRQLQRFWKVEDEPLLHDPGVGPSIADRQALDIWERTMKLTDGHYQASIPFKQRPPKFPDNKSAAEKRLVGLKKRLEKDSVLHETYKDEMEKLFKEGYAEPVTDREPNVQKHSAMWYVPHHPVFNPNKPKKCRIVFDCAAEYQHVSLNKEVLQGPDLMNNLVGVLTRFRQEAAAFTGGDGMG